jgi:hypothetical protein
MTDSFDQQGYGVFIREHVIDADEISHWLAAGEAMGDRPGWRFERTGLHPGPFGWCFGAGGSAHLVLTVTRPGFVLYDHTADEEFPSGTISGILAWLRLNPDKEAD